MNNIEELKISFESEALKYVENYSDNKNKSEDALMNAQRIMQFFDSIGKLEILKDFLDNDDIRIRLVSALCLIHSVRYGGDACQVLNELVDLLPKDSLIRTPAIGMSSLYKINKKRIESGKESVMEPLVS